MTEKFYTENYRHDYTHFGGKIDLEDFNTNSPNKKRISNQIDANNLQSVLANKRKDEKQYKNMTLEELREMKLVSNTNGRPSPTLTDEKWQKEFNIRKLFVTPYSPKIKRLKHFYSMESGTWNEDAQGTYYGCTTWQSYCSYINDVLNNIRSGQIDYCYYIYQIMELTKFHYNSLRTKYCDGYWEVWLERRSL